MAYVRSLTFGLERHVKRDLSYPQDLERIREHLFGGLAIALLKRSRSKSSISQSPRERINDALSEHFDQLHRSYLAWRIRDRSGDVGSFLSNCPEFQLPEVRRGDSPLYSSPTTAARSKQEIRLRLRYDMLLKELNVAGYSPGTRQDSGKEKTWPP